MNQLEDMRMLLEIVDRGSFSKAATRIGYSKQLLSRRMIALEARLGARLLVRSTRALTLTEIGREYVERARRILADVDEAEQIVLGNSQMPRGRLRLSAPMSFGTMHLSPLIVGFMQLHPAVEISLDLSDRQVDIIGEGYDMAVRIGSLGDSSLIARKLVELELVVCASPDYLRRAGTPQAVRDLARHACLTYGNEGTTAWYFEIGGKAVSHPVAGHYRANNGEVLRDAAVLGLGLTQLPTFIVGAELTSGALVRVLDDCLPSPGAAYAVYPQHRQRSPIVRALIDYFAACLTAPPWGSPVSTTGSPG